MSIITPELAGIIRTQKDWYRNAQFLDIYNQLFVEKGDSEARSAAEKQGATWEVIRFFAQALAAGEVMLTGSDQVKPGFNDDDRPGRFSGATPVSTDTIVVHHTAAPEEMTQYELEALGLLRLYLGFFIDNNNGFYKFLLETNPHLVDQQPLAPTSGHFVSKDGQEVQTFVGYHYMIDPDGSVKKLLQHDEMGFHAGNIGVNRRSLGIAFAGDMSAKEPTQAAKQAFINLAKQLSADNPGMKYLVGHGQVRLNGPTDCPGEWFAEFQKSPELAEFEVLQIKK